MKPELRNADGEVYGKVLDGVGDEVDDGVEATEGRSPHSIANFVVPSFIVNFAVNSIVGGGSNGVRKGRRSNGVRGKGVSECGR